jgi:hypothetical protein
MNDAARCYAWLLVAALLLSGLCWLATMAYALP